LFNGRFDHQDRQRLPSAQLLLGGDGSWALLEVSEYHVVVR